MTQPQLRWLTPGGVERYPLSELAGLRARTDGFVWLDVAEPDETTATVLTEAFALHPKSVPIVLERNHVPRLHADSDRLFVVVHTPLSGDGGHVHYLELDVLVGPGFLVTVHGPRNPIVPLEALLVESGEVADRLEAGRLRPRSPVELAGAILSTICRSQENGINRLAGKVGQLEQRVMTRGDREEPHAFLAELFGTRHELLTTHTMASQAAEIFTRAAHVLPMWSKHDHAVLTDVRDQYTRIARISQAQLDFLSGATEYYRAKTDTKTTIAAERLAVIAAVTLPVTAISSVMGMNVIVNDSTQPVFLTVLLVAMVVLSALLLYWARRQGWW